MMTSAPSLARSCVDMHLVGDLSSVRLRDELVALLGEGDIEWTLGRLFELGIAREVHPKLATGAKTVALVQKLDSLAAAGFASGQAGDAGLGHLPYSSEYPVGGCRLRAGRYRAGCC